MRKEFKFYSSKKRFLFYSSKKRFFGLFALIFTVFAIVIGRLVWLQIVRGDAMARQSMAQAMGTDVMYSPRGAIVDCNGEELAVSIMAKSLYVDPVEMEDRPDSAWRQIYWQGRSASVPKACTAILLRKHVLYGLSVL